MTAAATHCPSGTLSIIPKLEFFHSAGEIFFAVGGLSARTA